MDSSKQKGNKNLKKARMKSGLTQAEIAEKINVHVNYYARIERGEVRPSLDTLEAITKILKVKSSDILPF
jgi:transcriptional regulator with XRE-family HTH domain